MHETNTFSRVPTDMATIQRRDYHLENEIPAAFRGTRSAFGGTFEAADKFGWSLVHPVSANPNPSGTVTQDAFERITGMILDAVDVKGPIDGALLHLHGAMVSESYEDAEGEFLARLRQRLGADVPVVVTLDLHANVTQCMAENASALIAYRTYPHIDQYERAWQGAELLERAMRGAIRPRTVIAKRPMIYGLDHGRTQRGPMAELIARGEALESRGEALVVSICAGFSRANIRDVGPSVTVTVDGDARRAQAIAEDFMDYAWQTRNYTTVKLLSVAEAVQEGARAGVGAKTTLILGGKTDPSMGGGPLSLAGEVVCLTNGRFIAYGPMGGGVARDYGPSMVFRVGGVDIIIITHNGQAVDLGQFTSLGIDPTRYRTVAVKSMQHFRAAFGPIAREVILVNTDALCSEIYTPELFTKVRRPVWPLDPIIDPHAS
jgi:microcystin degradation protein MlrC